MFIINFLFINILFLDILFCCPFIPYRTVQSLLEIPIKKNIIISPYTQNKNYYKFYIKYEVIKPLKIN